MTSSVLSVGAKEYDMAEPGGGLITMTMTEAYKTQTQQQILEQSIEVVRRRIDEMGTASPTSRARATTASWCRCRACRTPTELKAILGKTAKMTFQLVDETADPTARAHRADRRRSPAADERQSQAGQPPDRSCSAG